MPKYRVSVEWVMVADVIIEADSDDEAMDEAREAKMPEGSYVSGSWEVRGAEEIKEEKEKQPCLHDQ